MQHKSDYVTQSMLSMELLALLLTVLWLTVVESFLNVCLAIFICELWIAGSFAWYLISPEQIYMQ